jgi:hypothetical protein
VRGKRRPFRARPYPSPARRALRQLLAVLGLDAEERSAVEAACSSLGCPLATHETPPRSSLARSTWDLITQQYDQMMGYATAMNLGTADSGAILPPPRGMAGFKKMDGRLWRIGADGSRS